MNIIISTVTSVLSHVASRLQLETLKKRVFATAAPKSLYGRPLSGAMFATLVQEYCSAMNDDRAPIIKSAWDRVADQQCRDAVEVGVGVYKSSMAAAVGGGEAMDGTQIDAAHRIAMKAAMDAFLKGAIKVRTCIVLVVTAFLDLRTDLSKLSRLLQVFSPVSLFCESLVQDSETFDDNESSLLAEVDIAYAAFQRRNASLCAELCDRLFVDLSESAVSALKAAVDGKEDANASSLVIAYGRALQGLIDGFSERAKGVGRFQYLTERLTDVFQRTLQSAAVSIDDKSKKGIQELQSQVSTATARLEQASLDATKSAKEVRLWLPLSHITLLVKRVFHVSQHSDALAVVREELAQAVRRGAEDSQQLSARLQSANEEAAQLKTSVGVLVP